MVLVCLLSRQQTDVLDEISLDEDKSTEVAATIFSIKSAADDTSFSSGKGGTHRPTYANLHNIQTHGHRHEAVVSRGYNIRYNKPFDTLS